MAQQKSRRSRRLFCCVGVTGLDQRRLYRKRCNTSRYLVSRDSGLLLSHFDTAKTTVHRDHRGTPLFALELDLPAFAFRIGGL